MYAWQAAVEEQWTTLRSTSSCSRPKDKQAALALWCLLQFLQLLKHTSLSEEGGSFSPSVDPEEIYLAGCPDHQTNTTQGLIYY